jgi:hypothetical protein
MAKPARCKGLFARAVESCLATLPGILSCSRRVGKSMPGREDCTGDKSAPQRPNTNQCTEKHT